MNTKQESDEEKLNNPWLVAVWPGMGNVAVSAGYYLMAKLEMEQLAELPAREFFELNHVEVKGGLISSGRQPRSRFFVWKDPLQNHDIVVFIGEAQPPTGKYLYCRRLIEFARDLGVERILTFAAMATGMHPSEEARVFGAATDKEMLMEIRRLELEVLDDGHIGGLNGVLLGVAADTGLPGICLLGEMPHIFTQLPYPKASLAVLEAFTAMTRIELDVDELTEQAGMMDDKLEGIFEQIEEAMESQTAASDRSSTHPSIPTKEETKSGESISDKLAREDSERIESLFEMAKKNRTRAYELKAELDRLDVFSKYEDRFLDLFKS